MRRALLEAVPRRFQNIGGMHLQLLQQGFHLEAEDSRVPQQVTLLQVAFCGGPVRLLDKLKYAAAALIIQRLPSVDIAEACLWVGRRYAAGDQEAIIGQ